MKVIIAGCRDRCLGVADLSRVVKESGFHVTEVISGGAKGIDESGEKWAIEHGIPVRLFVADWGAHGKAAGPIRNREMAAYADALIAVWDGKSRGTKNMIDEAWKHGLRIHKHMVCLGGS